MLPVAAYSTAVVRHLGSPTASGGQAGPGASGPTADLGIAFNIQRSDLAPPPAG